MSLPSRAASQQATLDQAIVFLMRDEVTNVHTPEIIAHVDDEAVPVATNVEYDPRPPPEVRRRRDLF